MPRRKDLDSLLDEELDESFPASDPPSSNAGERIGQPERGSASRDKPKRARPEKKPSRTQR